MGRPNLVFNSDVRSPAGDRLLKLNLKLNIPNEYDDNSTDNITTKTEPSSWSETATSPSLNRRKDFFARSLASRTVSFVESELETVTARSWFFKSHRSSHGSNDDGHAVVAYNQTVARIDRSEIIAGDLLGEGGFSQVYSVESFCLSADPQEKEAPSTDYRPDHDFTDREHRIRKELAVSSQYAKKKYVVKHLRPDLRSTSTVRKFHSAAADFALEAKYLSHLDHPNIVKLRGWAAGGTSCLASGECDAYFLVLDRLDETLMHLIQDWRRTSVPPMTASEDTPPSVLELYAEKLNFAEQIASALQYLHRSRIMHRDVTPNNVGIIHGPEGKSLIQLFDFGLVRELPSHESDEIGGEDGIRRPPKDHFFQMSYVGTRRYMAPEVSSVEGCYNLQADVYSFTMVLYEMMTLITPFAMYGREMHQLLVVENNARPAVSAEWPTGLQELLQHGWAKDPADRPDVDELCQQLRSLSIEEDLKREGQNRPVEDSKPTNRRSGRRGNCPGGPPLKPLWFRSALCAIPERVRMASEGT